MRSVRSLVVVVLALVVLVVSSVAFADGRVALVVGNSTYAHIGRLPNPENDAADMAAALRRLGFEVTTEFDADRVELTEALRAFTRRSAGADVSLVFYAGHGIEMDGVNYLVPVDARLERDVDVRFETMTVDDLLVSTAGASLRLLILDACRNNPLARSMQRTAAIRSVSGGSFADLNEDLLGDETLVAYAAAAGTTAADGRGRNSPYTSVLLSHLETPLEIAATLRRLGFEVTTDLDARSSEFLPQTTNLGSDEEGRFWYFPILYMLSQVWIGSRDASSSRAALPLRYSATRQAAARVAVPGALRGAQRTAADGGTTTCRSVGTSG